MAEGRTLHLHATVIRDGRWYVARCLEVEVASQGETIESALANLKEALGLYFEDEPLPSSTDPNHRADRDPRPSVSRGLPRVSGDEVVRALRQAGFAVVGTRGSHCKLRHSESQRTAGAPPS